MVHPVENIKNLDSAVDLISTTLKRRRSEDILPYFFIVGAGVSVPEIPAAKTIVDLCMHTIKEENMAKYLNETKKQNVSIMDNYSNWMELAYPNKIDRKHFLKGLIQKSKISSANLMLAQILHSNKIATTVFTTNFDDQIKRALDLIGAKDVFVSENTMDNLVVDVNSHEIQIVHVHGTYNFYDCANLKSEIVNSANQKGTISPSRVLEDFLHARIAPIVIGYSGWEDDVIMTCLKERLKYPVPIKYIWVCYSQEDYEQLPCEIKGSEDIMFVLPSQDADTCDEESDVEDNCDKKSNVEDKMSNKNKPLRFVTEKQEIRATLFFNKIKSTLEIAPQMIFSNPYSYFSKMINNLLPDDEDVWYLRYWAQRMQHFGTSESDFDKLVKVLGQAFVAKDFEHAANIIGQLSQMELQGADLKCVLMSVIIDYMNGRKVMESSNSIHSVYLATLDFIEKKYKQLVEINVLRCALHHLLFNDNMHKLFKRSEVVDVIDRISVISGKDESLRSIHLESIYQKSLYLNDDNKKNKLLKQLIEKCRKNNVGIGIKHTLFAALLDLAKLKYNDEAIKLYEDAKNVADEIVAEFNVLKTKNIGDTEEKNRLVAEFSNGIFNTSFIAKSEILLKITSEKTLSTLASEIFTILEDPTSKISYGAKLDAIINLVRLPSSVLHGIKNVEKILTEYVDPDSATYIKNPCTRAKLYMAIIRISTEPKTQLKYCNKIFELEGTMPCDCEMFKTMLIDTIQYYSTLPIAIVPDSSKIPYLISLKKLFCDLPHRTNYFYEIVMSAVKDGEQKNYEESDLANDIAFYKKSQENLSRGYNMYCDKKFEAAETILKELLRCDVVSVQNQAHNNLACMVRRKETKNTAYTFEQLIEKVPDCYDTKHMNNILYYLALDDTEHPNYKNAIDALNKFSRDELQDVIAFWGNTDIVGAEESALAMKIIDGLDI